MKPQLADIDRDAGERAIAAALKESAARRMQTEDKLREEPWHDVAKFAAACAQDISLKLRCWQTPPALIDNPEEELREAGEDLYGRKAAARLVLRLQRRGLSKFEPDPEAALREAAARTAG